MTTFLLASASPTRRQLLEKAGISLEVRPARLDEEAIRQALLAEEVTPRDMADALAEYKAQHVAQRVSGQMILGCDQILALKGAILPKPNDRADAAQQLSRLSGQVHHLYSAAVIFDDGRPVWRSTTSARLSMHSLSPAEIEAYLAVAWPDVEGCVGAYQAEAYGARLFSRIDGDWFAVLGLPLLDILSYLRQRGLL